MTENSNAVRKFLAIKHSWRGSYNRIFKLGNNVFQSYSISLPKAQKYIIEEMQINHGGSL